MARQRKPVQRDTWQVRHDKKEARLAAIDPETAAALCELDQWDYENTGERAKNLGLLVSDLLAMTASNDPMYIGPKSASPGNTMWAEWCRDLWPRLDYEDIARVHDRRIHYKVYSFGDVLMPENSKWAGMIYGTGDAQEKSWDQLMIAVRNARYFHYLDFDQIEDQRNPAAANTRHLTRDWQPGKPVLKITLPAGEQDAPVELPEFPKPPDYKVEDFATGRDVLTVERQLANQRYHLEVWVEKTTMDDVLEPWCEAHGAVYVTASGHMTVTGAWECAERIRKRGKPAVLFYISDFDKDGQSMPPAIARKIERFLRVEYRRLNPPPVILQQVALTHEQVLEYGLPPVPVDDAAWNQRYPDVGGRVELDALEVYRPDELTRLLDEAAAPYWDEDLGERFEEAEADLQSDLDEIRSRIVDQHQEALEALQIRWEEAAKAARALLEPVWTDIQAEHKAIVKELGAEAPTLSNYPLPEAAEADPNLAEDALFDSRRSYWEQLLAYRRYKEEHVIAGE